MTDSENLHRRVEVYKLTIAKYSIDQAAEIARLIVEMDIDHNHQLYRPLHAAMIISYGRAFSEMKPFGKISSNWEKFEDPTDQHAHDILMDHRNKSVGHSDHIPKKIIIYPTGAKMFDGTIAPNVKTEILTNYIDPFDVRYIHQFATELVQRLSVAISEKMTVLYGAEGMKLKETIELISDEDIEVWKARAKRTR